MEVVVITGASSGVGREMALTLSRQAQVVAVARSEQKLAQLQNEVGERLSVFVGDMSKEDEISALTEYVNNKFGKLNILINNAGMGTFKPLLETETAEWREMHDTMVLGTFLCCRYLIPLIQQAGYNERRQVIINASRWAEQGRIKFCSGYVAAKFAQRGLSQVLREELRYEGIKVILLMPGSIDTPFFDNSGWTHDPGRILDPKAIAKMTKQVINQPNGYVVEEVIFQAINPD